MSRGCKVWSCGQRGGLRIHAELDTFLVSRWQGPVDSPANFVQRVPAIRGERGKILRSRWMLAWGKSTMRAFAGATATSGDTRKRESAHIKDTARLFASQMSNV